MKKWSILIFLVILIAIWQAFTVYNDAFEPERLMEEKALKRAEKEVAFTSIEEIYTYYGSQAYVVIVGTDEDDEKIIAWVPENMDDVIIAKQEDGISKQEAISILKAERNPQEIISVKLGMEKEVPLWELKYIDEENRYSFYYLSFEDGTFIQRYSFQQ
jgi:uncharacterized protein YpmB